jgi:hypothetical protein
VDVEGVRGEDDAVLVHQSVHVHDGVEEGSWRAVRVLLYPKNVFLHAAESNEHSPGRR